MFGAPLSVPIPDVDRTQHLLMLGANPLASNGSLMTAPDMRGRLLALQARGGKLVVVDPRRSRTAEAADEHHPIRPGTDAHLLFALVHVLFEEGLTAPGRLAELTDGIDAVEELAQPFTPEAVAPVTGIEAETIRRMARELAAAESAAVYGRIGTTTQEFGTLASWLVDVLNVLTGNLDRPGGAMFPRAAAGQRNSFGEPGRGRGVKIGRWHSRVRGLPESLGELPVAALAEEMETPGEGQIRALITLAGNPARSTPNSGRLDAALGGLDLFVALDIYVNETTRHADVILPAPSQSGALALRPRLLPALDPQRGQLLAGGAGARPGHAGRVGDAAAAHGARGRAAGARRRRAARPPGGGRAPAPRGRQRALAGARPRRRRAARRARAAPRARAAARHPAALRPVRRGLRRAAGRADARRARGRAARHRPRPARAAPARRAAHPERPDRARARADRGRHPAAARRAWPARATDGLVLVGRRQLRSNNSWMHNLGLLVSGPERCTLHVHPDDAARLGLEDGVPARVENRAGALHAPVEVTDKIMPGVVSLPHGWGHDAPGARLGVAAEHAGVNSNLLADEGLVDALSGNAVLNGIPVVVTAVPSAAPVPA